jgi:hypothetical protein
VSESRVPPLVLTRSGNAGRAKRCSSQPVDAGSPFNCVYEYMTATDECQGKYCENKKAAIILTAFLANSALPFLFHLQLTRTCARVERKEVRHQAIELVGIIDHGEMSRPFKVDLIHMIWKAV